MTNSLPNLNLKIMKKALLLVCCLFLALFGFYQIEMTVFAEQSGSSPESGTSSRIKTAYDWLVAKGANYGATDAGDWTNNWGTWWNRIMEAAAWEPDGTAAVGDVTMGKTFYAGLGDRTIKTGTYDPATSLYLPQSLMNWDDYETGDETGEESSWTNTAGIATTGVWKDGRTGLYWSNAQGQNSNIFPDQNHSACPFFSSTPRGSYDGLDADCGNAINTCGTLSLDADSLVAGGDADPETDWYLPSQKELQQAYIDGMYNQTNTTFTSSSAFWSSTEYSSTPANAWYVGLGSGATYYSTKVTATNYVRCVRRD